MLALISIENLKVKQLNELTKDMLVSVVMLSLVFLLCPHFGRGLILDGLILDC